MTMQMYWEIEPGPSASQEVDDIDAAIRALYMTADRARKRVPASASDLAESVTAMAARMLTDGARMMHNGLSWSATEGSVRVTLTP
ncbi:hypothetical protein [Actinacidiphila sp. bgisy160]|uniref:hypothetical protein n=1 Tax=Actinacidiphila sp. bgisy160 TaxID=3413796 RepID=UPI003D70FEA2